MSEFTYTLIVSPTLNGVPQDVIQVTAGHSEAQPTSGLISVQLEAGESAEFSFPEGGRGVGMFGTGPFTIDLGVSIPLKDYGGAGPYKVGFFLPVLVPPGAAITVTAPTDAPVAILVTGATSVTVGPPVSVAGDKEVISWAPDATYVATSGPEVGIYSLTPSADPPGSPDRVIIDQAMFVADLTYRGEPGGNTLNDVASVRVLFANPPGSPAVPYGVGLTIPAGSTALLQVSGDIAGAPIPAGSEILFERNSIATLGTLNGDAYSARLRTV